MAPFFPRFIPTEIHAVERPEPDLCFRLFSGLFFAYLSFPFLNLKEVSVPFLF